MHLKSVELTQAWFSGGIWVSLLMEWMNMTLTCSESDIIKMHARAVNGRDGIG